MSENQHGASNQAELLMLYEASGRDTWETKRQQWMVTYYGLLLHAALVGYVALRTEPEPSPVELASVEKLLIVILASFMAVSGFWYLTTSQISLVKFRRRAARIRTYLGEAFRQCYGEENPIRTSSHKDYWLVLTMMGALLASPTLHNSSTAHNIRFHTAQPFGSPLSGMASARMAALIGASWPWRFTSTWAER